MTYAGGQGCSAVGVADTRISLEQQTVNLPCDGGNGPLEGTVSGLQVGAQFYTITGVNDGFSPVAVGHGTVRVVGGQTVTQPVDVPLGASD